MKRFFPKSDSVAGSSKVFVLHVDHRPDGNGDVRHAFDISVELINLFPQAEIHLVIAHKGKMDWSLINTELEEPYNKQVIGHFFQIDQYQFECNGKLHDHYKLSDCKVGFKRFVSEDISLNNAYTAAKIVFIISTPFPQEFFKKYITPETRIITITEHCATSFLNDDEIGLTGENYVLGIDKIHSGKGLLIKDTRQEPMQALLSITDQRFLQKLGFSQYPLTPENAKQYLEDHLIVPIYYQYGFDYILRPLIYALSHSPLAVDKKMVFVINRNNPDLTEWNRFKSELPLKVITTISNFPLENTASDDESASISIIAGYWFEKSGDFKNLCNLAFWMICSGDKTLEVAVEKGAPFIYSAPNSKFGMFWALKNTVTSNYRKILEIANPASVNPALTYHAESCAKQMLCDIQKSNIPTLFNSEVRQDCANFRTWLLKNRSFYKLLPTIVNDSSTLQITNIPNQTAF
ncbi:MAG: hypothetical protein AMJ43_05800 [Coxiella sp. DG_40]|nr:MAG: hypothetical protein AMJ43_05800 [Coxiella sp. DG_40]